MVLKITIIVDCLANGGAEKAASALSCLLSKAAYRVTIIALRDDIVYNYCGVLINLGTDNSSIKVVKQFQKTLKLRSALQKIKPHYIIDFRLRNRFDMEFVLYLSVFKKYQMVYTMHSFNINYHIPKGNFFIKVYNKSIVTAVSKNIKLKLEEAYGITNVHYIPNPVNQKHIKETAENETINEDFILAVGRLYNPIKQFDKLIDTYLKSHLPPKNIKLYILGDGDDRQQLQAQINGLNVQHLIKLFGFVKNPYAYIKAARYLVLCSKYEGYPMVILEALALNTPVVAFDCQSGPSEMIAHNVNGLLIEDQNFEALLTAMNYLLKNNTILDEMRTNTQKNTPLFSEKDHLKYWGAILK
jgi:N-acetylgalactosamine-N,N'-diacetylbacillosaminyl-diphospho-undecaprenol 4-alpha-N-acetylgalactosaminyltransferase